MKQPPSYTSWWITCHSPAECEGFRQSLSSSIDLERVLTDSVRSVAGGVGHAEVAAHRLADFFADISALPPLSGNPSAFRLVFRKHLEAGRFWKDLIVNILQEIEAAPQVAGITLDSKGDEESPTTVLQR